MTTFLLKLTLCWGFFALLYTLLLRQETFFRANRAYLLGTTVLGVLLAAWPSEQLPVPVYETGEPMVILPVVAVGIQQAQETANAWESLDFLWVMYGLGAVLALLRMLWGLAKIAQMAMRGHAERLPDGCLLIQTEEAEVPFSFFKWVFVPAGLSGAKPQTPTFQTSNMEAMLAHERAHAHGWHSADVLLAELLCVALWFHPLAHWYRRALRTVHEYLADAEASRRTDKKQYGLLLIRQSQSGMPIAFANHFFQSPLKQRFVMLTKKASAPGRVLKFGLVAPLAVLFAVLFRQAPAIAQVVDKKHADFVRQLEAGGWMLTDTVVTFNPDTYEERIQIVRNSAAPEKDESGNLVYRYAEVQPQFPGGQEALTRFLQANLRYPEDAVKARAEAMVSVWLVVDEAGNLLKIKAHTNGGILPREDMEAEAERVVRDMPRWQPAQHKGKPVRCRVNFPIEFRLGAVPVATPNNSKIVVSDAETMPEYPGGQSALFQFLNDNLKYPEAAQAMKAEGTVYVKFLVNEDGSLSNIAPYYGNGNHERQELEAEAARIVSIMPKWKPAVKNGKVVKKEMILPFKFKLSDEDLSSEVDTPAEFPGGSPALMKFLAENIKYPEEAKKANAEGMAVIQFVVEKDGTLSNFENLKKDVRQDLTDEAMRVLRTSPKWTPATKDGQPVRVKMTLPIRFKL